MATGPQNIFDANVVADPPSFGTVITVESYWLVQYTLVVSKAIVIEVADFADAISVEVPPPTGILCTDPTVLPLMIVEPAQ